MSECQYARDLPLDDENEAIYIRLQKVQCISSKGKSSFCIINSHKTCISTEVADLIYDKVEKNQVPRIETMQ